MLSFADLLGKTVAAIDADGADPDGPVTRQGLLLAAHAGLTVYRAPGAGSQWDLYSLAIGEAVEALHAGLSQRPLLAADVPDAGADEPQLRSLVRILVGRLADRYAAAAAEADDTDADADDRTGGGRDRGVTRGARRHRVWAEVAHRLDDAAAQLQ